MHAAPCRLALIMLALPLVAQAAPRGERAGWQSLAQARTESTVNGHVLTDAPVPSVAPPGLPPSERVAGAGSRPADTGPTNSTPFSSTPSGSLSSGGAQVSNRDRVVSPPDASGVTPNLGK